MGDSINMVAYNKKQYYKDIIESKPSNAISIIETDCEVDFAPPLDYKEPEKPAASVPSSKTPAGCMTCVCPCLTFGHIAEIINEGRTPWYETGLTYLLLALPGWILGFGFVCNASFPYTFLHRLRMRNKFKIEGNLLSDCAAHAFCQYCAMSQEFRELGHRGFEVPLGWNGNMDMHMRAAAVYQFTPPDVEQEMTR